MKHVRGRYVEDPELTIVRGKQYWALVIGQDGEVEEYDPNEVDQKYGPEDPSYQAYLKHPEEFN